MIRRRLPRCGPWPGWPLVAALLASACVEVDGGAVELNWAVVSQHDGTVLRFCQCPEPSMHEVASLALVLRPRAAEAAQPQDYWFACSPGRGTTSFSIPPGDYDLSLRPTSATGVDLTIPVPPLPPRAFPSPPVLVRRIVHGQVASLDVWTIRLDCVN